MANGTNKTSQDAAQQTSQVVSSGASGQAGQSLEFCGREEQVSTHTCNSIHPAVAFDRLGNIGIVWQDTRDGNFEIYFKALTARISEREATLGAAGQVDPLTGRVIDISCVVPSSSSGLATFSLDDRISDAKNDASRSDSGGALDRRDGGRLDVNPSTRTAVFAAAPGTNLIDIGLRPDNRVRIETGVNAGTELLVTRILAPTVADVAFIDTLSSDSGFIYSLLSTQSPTLSSGEARLTCDAASSIFPDVVADSAGRFHIICQDNTGGSFQLRYMQVFPNDVGPSDDCLSGQPIISTGGFGEVAPGTPGSVSFVDNSVPNAPITRAFLASGASGQFFAFGTRLPPEARGTGAGTTLVGTHVLFRDFTAGGLWTGVSRLDDRSSWESQFEEGAAPTPDVLLAEGHPVIPGGGFGTRFDFSNLAFLAQTPPDASVIVQTIALPIMPTCAPGGPAGSAAPREQDLVPLPAKPVPPAFVDPVDLSQVLNSPFAEVDPTTMPRFTIEGDKTGTVFTNVLVRDPRGILSRLVFRREGAEGCDEFKFVLGQERCGDASCAVRVPDAPGMNATDASPARYKRRLQIWAGPDYRVDPAQLDSAMLPASLLLDRTFAFDAGEDMSTFTFEGDLVLPAGRVIFFVPIAGEEFMVRASGGGNAVWSTDGDGSFDQYAPPFTVPPFMGLSASVYYDGTLAQGVEGATFVPPSQDVIINTRTADVAASIAFGDSGGRLDKASALAQGFTLSAPATLDSVSIRMARGTSAGQDTNGNAIPENTNRKLLVEIYRSGNGEPSGEPLASVAVPARSIRAFDDADAIPKDEDMGEMVAALDLSLEAESYFVVFREENDVDQKGRFWSLAAIDGDFFAGSALWNDARPFEPGRWKSLTGQLQMMASLRR